MLFLLAVGVVVVGVSRFAQVLQSPAPVTSDAP
jgi:hypothetical protein